MNGYGWLWETTWQASLLVAFVLVAQRAFRRWLTAEWRDALWWLVVIRLCLPVLPQSSFGLFQSDPDWGGAPERIVLREAVSVPVRANAPSAPAETVASAPLELSAPRATEINWWWLQVVWGIGAMTVLGWTTAAYFFVRRRIAGLPEVSSGRLVMLLDSARRSMGVRRPVRLHESSDGFGPAVVGLWRPRMVIPAGLATELSDAELRHVLLHECGHLRRFDLGLNWLIALLQALHWFNPILWWAFQRMRADRELACDEMTMRVSGESRAYGETIVRLLERAMFGGKPGLIGIVEKRADIRERIRMIAAFRRSSRWSLVALTLMLALGLTMLTRAKQAPAAPKIVLSPVVVSETGTGMRQADLLERVENMVWDSREREHWARSSGKRTSEFARQSALWQDALSFHVAQRDRIIRELDEQITGDEDRFRLLERERGLWQRQLVRLGDSGDMIPLRNVAGSLRVRVSDDELSQLAETLRAAVAAIDRGDAMTASPVGAASELWEWRTRVLGFYRTLVRQVNSMTGEARNGRLRVHEAASTEEATQTAKAWIGSEHFHRAEPSLVSAMKIDPRRFLVYALRRTILERRIDPQLYQSTSTRD